MLDQSWLKFRRIKNSRLHEKEVIDFDRAQELLQCVDAMNGPLEEKSRVCIREYGRCRPYEALRLDFYAFLFLEMVHYRSL